MAVWLAASFDGVLHIRKSGQWLSGSTSYLHKQKLGTDGSEKYNEYAKVKERLKQ